MTKSELIEILLQEQPHLKLEDVELAVKTILDLMSQSLADGERIEIRGFGSFYLHTNFGPTNLKSPMHNVGGTQA